MKVKIKLKFLPVIILSGLTFLTSATYGEQCLSQYQPKSPTTQWLSNPIDFAVLKKDMELAAHQAVVGLVATEGLTLQYHELTNLKLKSYFGLARTDHQTTKIFEDLFVNNENYVRLNKNTTKYSELMKSAQNLADQIIEIKSATENLNSKPKKTTAEFQELLVQYSDKIDQIQWLETEIKKDSVILKEVTQKMSIEFKHVLDIYQRSENYIDGLVVFTQKLTLLASEYPSLISRFNSLIGLFYESIQNRQGYLDQLKRLTDAIDQQVTTNANILKRFDQDTAISFTSFLLQQGLSPGQVSSLLDDIQVAKAQVDEKKSKGNLKKQNREKLIEKIKRKGRIAAAGLGIVGAAFSGNIAFEKYSQRDEIAKQEYTQSISQSVGTLTSTQVNLMKKYEGGLNKEIKNMTVFVNSPFATEAYIANFAKTQTRADALSPSEIIYLVNYSTAIIKANSAKNSSWTFSHELISRILSINISRPYTDVEKADLVQSVNFIKHGWEELLKKQVNLGWIKKEELAKELTYNKDSYDQWVTYHLSSFESKKAKYEGEDRTAKAELDKDLAYKSLKNGPRYLINDPKILTEISAEQAHPVIKGMFESKTQRSFWLQLANYVETNKISNSDLFYILLHTKEFSAIPEASNDTADFRNRVSDFAGLQGSKRYEGLSDLGLETLRKVLTKLNLDSVGQTEAVLLKKMLHEIRIFSSDSYIPDFRDHSSAFLSSILDRALVIKKTE